MNRIICAICHTHIKTLERLENHIGAKHHKELWGVDSSDLKAVFVKPRREKRYTLNPTAT